jgi:hypothetical protein
MTFTEWLFTHNLVLDSSDPVHRLAVSNFRNFNWPIEVASLEELLDFFKAAGMATEDRAYAAKLAWEDYKKFLLTQTP